MRSWRLPPSQYSMTISTVISFLLISQSKYLRMWMYSMRMRVLTSLTMCSFFFGESEEKGIFFRMTALSLPLLLALNSFFPFCSTISYRYSIYNEFLFKFQQLQSYKQHSYTNQNAIKSSSSKSQMISLIPSHIRLKLFISEQFIVILQYFGEFYNFSRPIILFSFYLVEPQSYVQGITISLQGWLGLTELSCACANSASRPRLKELIKDQSFDLGRSLLQSFILVTLRKAMALNEDNCVLQNTISPGLIFCYLILRIIFSICYLPTQYSLQSRLGQRNSSVLQNGISKTSPFSLLSLQQVIDNTQLFTIISNLGKQKVPILLVAEYSSLLGLLIWLALVLGRVVLVLLITGWLKGMGRGYI